MFSYGKIETKKKSACGFLDWRHKSETPDLFVRLQAKIFSSSWQNFIKRRANIVANLNEKAISRIDPEN